MFEPKTAKIAETANRRTALISELEALLTGRVYIYIDYANVRPWSDKLGWHVDLKRLKQFHDSFANIEQVKLYCGTLAGDDRSEREVAHIRQCGYLLRTKPVKIMRFPIKAASVPPDSPALLENFIKKSLLRKYTGETIEYLNRRFSELNKLGEFYIEDRKCNFDVEIGVDMLLDESRDEFDTCILWSGDSDFHDPVQKLLQSGKKVILFATARRIAKELNEIRDRGLLIFDIQKIRDFICWNRELPENLAKQKGSAEADCP